MKIRGIEVQDGDVVEVEYPTKYRKVVLVGYFYETKERPDVLSGIFGVNDVVISQVRQKVEKNNVPYTDDVGCTVIKSERILSIRKIGR
jgi:hypothetical protein